MFLLGCDHSGIDVALVAPVFFRSKDYSGTDLFQRNIFVPCGDGLKCFKFVGTLSSCFLVVPGYLWIMAQAQLNPQLLSSSTFRAVSQELLPASPRQFFIAISPELTLKVRKKSGELVLLFYYRNKKSFSLPISLFHEILNSAEIISIASQLIQGDSVNICNGGSIDTGNGCDNAGFGEQFR